MPKFIDFAAESIRDIAVRMPSAVTRAAARHGVNLNGPIPRLPAATGATEGPRRWADKVEKLTIGSLDDNSLTVVAQYNPKDLQIDKQVPWQPHNRWPATGERPRDSDQDEVEINSATTRSMSIELLFDGYEEHRSVQPEIDKLETLSSFQPGTKKVPRQRPHHCVVAWGVTGTRRFRCVIESLSTKLVMFAPDGTPLRAACTVKLKEVLTMAKLQGSGQATR